MTAIAFVGAGSVVFTRQLLAALTLEHHRVAFERAGVKDAWDQVVALVVQPGVEFLKVGPGLTFALREALSALAAIEEQVVTTGSSRLTEVVESRMVAEPKWWYQYYEGDDRELKLARRYSFSDRVRYYWPDAEISAAVDRLFVNLTKHPVPLPMLSAYLPAQFERVRTGRLRAEPRSLVVDHVQDVLRNYSSACSSGSLHA